jgi:uncharacterized alkaline shock family protein YloU
MTGQQGGGMDMADNSSPEVKLNDNPAGTVSFATEVVATIAGLAANEVEGVASMTSSNSALADILTRKSSRNYTKGVKVDIDDNRVTVDVTIVVEYGSPVPDVARSIQENVKKAIETMSGLGVRNVDVHVQGVSFGFGRTKQPDSCNLLKTLTAAVWRSELFIGPDTSLPGLASWEG